MPFETWRYCHRLVSDSFEEMLAETSGRMRWLKKNLRGQKALELELRSGGVVAAALLCGYRLSVTLSRNISINRTSVATFSKESVLWGSLEYDSGGVVGVASHLR